MSEQIAPDWDTSPVKEWGIWMWVVVCLAATPVLWSMNPPFNLTAATPPPPAKDQSKPDEKPKPKPKPTLLTREAITVERIVEVEVPIERIVTKIVEVGVPFEIERVTIPRIHFSFDSTERIAYLCLTAFRLISASKVIPEEVEERSIVMANNIYPTSEITSRSPRTPEGRRLGLDEVYVAEGEVIYPLGYSGEKKPKPEPKERIINAACSRCRGTGKIGGSRSSYSGGTKGGSACPACKGTGKVKRIIRYSGKR